MKVEINGDEHELAEGASARDAAEAVGVEPGAALRWRLTARWCHAAS